MGHQDRLQKAVDRNYEAFRKQLPGLLETNQGQFALLHHGEIIKFFDTVREAVLYGQDNFDDDLYSVQEVTDTACDLGWFSHAVD